MSTRRTMRNELDRHGWNLRTVKEKVSQIKKGNGELTAPDTEVAQTLGEYFSSVFIDEGQYAQSYNEKMNMDTGLSDIDSDQETTETSDG